MKLVCKNEDELLVFYRMIIKILLLLSKVPENEMAVGDVERIFYLAEIEK